MRTATITIGANTTAYKTDNRDLSTATGLFADRGNIFESFDAKPKMALPAAKTVALPINKTGKKLFKDDTRLVSQYVPKSIE